MTPAVYVAAPLLCRARALDVVGRLRSFGIRVVSTWHDTTTATRDPTDATERCRALFANKTDMARANVVLALTDQNAGRETYVETGRMLERGTMVIFSEERGGLPLSAEDGVVFESDAAAIQRIVDMVGT